MYQNRKFAEVLVWLQLVFSALLAATVIFGYARYHTTLGEATRSLSTVVVSTANLVAQTAEAVQTKQALLDNSISTLTSSRKLIQEIRKAAQNQSMLLPKYAAGLESASGVLSKTGETFSALGTNLNFSMPTSVQMDGLRPVWVYTRPLAQIAQNISSNAQQLKSLGESLRAVSSTVAADGQNVSAAVLETSAHAIATLDETEKALATLKAQDLPRAVTDLKAAAENLRRISTQVDIAGNIGLVFLVAGLLLAGWCFLNSLSVLHLIKAPLSQSAVIEEQPKGT